MEEKQRPVNVYLEKRAVAAEGKLQSAFQNCGRLYFPKLISLTIFLILYAFWETWHPLIKTWALIPLPWKLDELLTHL